MFRLYKFMECVRGQYLHLTIMHVTWYDLEDCPLDRNVRRKILWHLIKSIVMEECVSVGSWVKVKVKVEVESKIHPITSHEVPEGCRGNL